MNRRSILKGLAAAPLGAHVAAEQAKAGLMSMGAAGLGGASGYGSPVPGGGGGPLKIFSLKDWLSKCDSMIRREAYRFTGFDADIVEMHLPLNTKMRMQRERNYKRMVQEQKEAFERRLSLHGFAEWWG